MTDRSTWTEIAFLLLRLPLGILGFMIVTVIVSLVLQGLVEPVLVAVGLQTQIGLWRMIDTIAESLIFVPVSVVFLLVGPRLLLAWGNFSAWAATAMLGCIDLGVLKRALGEVLDRVGPADAFQLMDELHMRFGRGRFLTPIQVQAALLALESSGLVVSRSVAHRMVYALA